jgi:hypothetical protein
MSWTAEEVQKAYQAVSVKAAMDKAFRARLLANPHEAIAEMTGRDVPAAFKIKIIENDPAYHMTFVLPDMVSEELSDEALSKVAGGVSVALIVGACAVAIDTGGPCTDACGVAAGGR